jgi:hypothetical protein
MRIRRMLFAARLIALPVVAAGPALAQPVVDSPLSGAEPRDGVREVTIEPGAMRRLASARGPVLVAGFPMPGGGGADLIVEPFEVLEPDARVVIGGPGGEFEIGRPDVRLYRGEVDGADDSAVFLSFSAHGIHGVIRTPERTAILTSGPVGAGLPTVIAGLDAFPVVPDFAQGWACNVGPEHINPLGIEVPAGAGGDGTRENPCRVVRVAVDSDFEYTDRLFGGDIEASAAYVLTLLGAVGEIYTRDLNVRLVVPFVRVWEENNDPYNGGDLGAFRNEWNANMRHVERDLAHKLSGAYGGGVAWVSVLCHQTYGYGLSGVNGSFPYPLRDHDGGNWDLMVVAHELGHNFGTLHTHDGYDPPIDGCGNGDCSDAYGGTIMSYCHICSGGMTNIQLRFHPRVIDRISAYMNTVCDLSGDSRAFAYDDHAAALRDTPTIVDVLANDLDINCPTPTIVSVSGVSQRGGVVEISEGTGEGGRDEVLYTPPAGYTGDDRFFYTIETGPGVRATADAFLDVLPVREADELGASRPGLAASYYELQAPDRLPDFDGLTPYRRGFVEALNFPSGTGDFAGSGRSTNVGAVFRGAVFVPETGLYTISIESDDGSRVVLDDQTLIDNDGVHGMQERAATLGLEAGPHRLRIEFFQRFSRHGLIARIEGPGLDRQPIAPAMWRSDHCIADWSFDGVVDTIDFLAFLADWNLREPSTDLNGDGVINTPDIIAFLNAWVEGC